jgi:hypothetical protein
VQLAQLDLAPVVQVGILVHPGTGLHPGKFSSFSQKLGKTREKKKKT